MRALLASLCLICLWIPGSAVKAQKADILQTRYLRTAHDGLFDIQLIGKRGWAVGDHGLLVLTEDGGRSWRIQETPAKSALLGIDVKPNGRGVIVGQGGLILYTENAQDEWLKSRSGIRERLFSVSINSGGFGLAVGEFGTILRTKDHGKSWAVLKPDWIALLETEDAPHLYDVLVENGSAALAVGEFGLVMATKDAGDNWSILNRGDESLFALTKDATGEYWAMGQSGILIRSRELDQTWHVVNLSQRMALLNMYLDAKGEGVLLAMDAALFTVDGGMSWRSNPALKLPTPWYQALAVTIKGDYLLAGAFGSIVEIKKAIALKLE